MTPEQLGAGRGSFRCGHCHTLFDALPSLAQQLPLDLSGSLPRHPLQNSTPVLDQAVARSKPPQADLFEHLEASTGRAPDRLPSDWDDALGTRSDSLRSPTAIKAPVSGRLLLLNSILAISLVVQLGYAEREWLLDQSWVRTVAAPLAQSVGHRLAPRHDHAQLQLLERDVRPHPVVPGALLISASIRNRDREALRYPMVEVRLTDIDGKVYALRRFSPTDYLSDATQIDRGLAAGALVPLVFEVVDPGQQAMNFEFRFL